MEKITTRQIDYIKDLSEKYQISVPNLLHFTLDEAAFWIKEVLHNGKEKSDEVKIKINPVLMGMVQKLVYRKYCDDGINPLDYKKKFLKEVEQTYLLFEFK